MSCKLYGDWAKAGVILRTLATQLMPFARGKLDENGKLVLDTIQGHIDNQDLSWTPLAESTVKKKKGDSTIYVETGSLRDGLTVRKIKSSQDTIVLFIGASPWKRHKESGLKMSDLMIYLEYGTTDGKIPPRPLIEPSFEEVKSKIEKEWKGTISAFIGGTK